MREATARQLPEEDVRDTGAARRLRLVETGTDLKHSASVPNPSPPEYAENGRRTVTITGHPVPARRRRSPTATKVEARPDRIALWAFLLGLFLVFMAVATASAATL